jgi:sugar lactone lactonase YvrE
MFLSLKYVRSLSLTRGVAKAALSGHDGRDGGCRFSRTIAALRTRQWMPLLVCLLVACQGARAQNGVFTPSQPVGVPSAAQSVTVTAQAAGAVNAVQVLTMGAPGLDFKVGDGASTCVQGTLLAVNGTCTESVSFTPASPGPRQGAVVLRDSDNNVLGIAYLSGTGLGGLPVLVAGNVKPIAGVSGQWTSDADLDQPSSITLDGAGNVYIADSAHNRIQMWCAGKSATIAGIHCTAAGVLLTVAGTGAPGFAGDGGLATAAELDLPSGITLDGAGNLYIADTNNNLIRKVTAATGIITTVAGSETPRGLGNGGYATAAGLDQPEGVTVDASGNLYIADTYNQQIRKVDAQGIITAVAGNGAQSASGDGSGTYSGDTDSAVTAGLNKPYAVAFDAAGNMYIPDSGNNVIRKVNTAGTITTFVGFYPGTAGSGGVGGAAAKASLNDPTAVAFDAAGNLYIADTANARILKVTAAISPTHAGLVSVFAASGTNNVYTATGGVKSNAIYAPAGIFVDGNANLYYANYFYYMTVAEIESQQSLLEFTGTPVQQGDQSLPETQTVENGGNAPLDLTSANIPEVPPNALIDPGTTTCDFVITLAVDENCNVGVVFAPALPPALVIPGGATSELVKTDVDVYGNSNGYPQDKENFPLDIVVVGRVVVPNATTTMVTGSPNPSDYGQMVTFIATVTSSKAAGTPVGTVVFTDGATQLGAPVTLDSAGVATYTTTAPLPVGPQTITATFTAAAGKDFLPSSGSYTQNVDELTDTSLSSSANPSALGAPVTFTATVTISGGGGVVPDGTVIFTDTTTGTILGTQALPANGIVSLPPIATLTQGVHVITADYGGDAAKDILGSTGTLSQVISPLPASFTLTVTPGTLTIPTTKNTTVNVALTSINGFTDTIELGCTALPVAVTCHFSTDSVNLAANGLQNVALTIDTNNPLGGGGTASLNAQPGNKGFSLAGLFLPFSALFGCIFWRFRKRYAAAMTTALVLLLGGAALLVSGCSGFTQTSASPGTYTIQVVGVGANTGVTQYQNVSLTITQ